MPARTRVAIVHDWLTGMRGGEKVLEQLCLALPDADLFTLVHAPGRCSDTIESHPIRTSVLNDLPGARRWYRHLLPAMPIAIERMDVSEYDLVVSSSHCVAKGIGGRRPGQLHVCYCYTPMRYVWVAPETYSRRLGLAGLTLRLLGPYLRAWDLRSARRVDQFLAVSAHVAERIHRIYRAASAVLYPPVDVDYFTPAAVEREDFYLVVSAAAPYKRIDHALAAAQLAGVHLRVVGAGQELDRLRRTAPANVKFLGWCDADTLRDHYRRCRAVLFPQLEDFGIVPLEAMACGAPVIAYGAGGALETVLDAANDAIAAPTGLLYTPQTPEALADAIGRFENLADRFDPAALRARAEQFSPEAFRGGFRRLVSPLLARRGLACPWPATAPDRTRPC